jgi:hypothetical protein
MEQNFEFGRGKVWIALEDDGFDTPAYRYLGQTPGFEITMTPERIDLKSSDGPSRETIASVVIENEATGTMTCHNVSQENLALFLAGNLEQVSQLGGAFSFEIADIKQGFSYWLGEESDDVDGLKSILTVAVSGAVEGVDFEVDKSNGRFYVIPGSLEILEGDTVTVTGTVAARQWMRNTSSDKGEVRCRLKFEANNASGENRMLTLPLVSLAPSGSYQPQSEDDFVALEFEFTVLKSGLERIIIDGVAVAP